MPIKTVFSMLTLIGHFKKIMYRVLDASWRGSLSSSLLSIS
ncbi:MAG TPA: hypothetical protein PKY50_11260 [Candidatus Competibacter sp.]|nr:hypothetical protein [Candidatus Competibacter sp.]